MLGTVQFLQGQVAAPGSDPAWRQFFHSFSCPHQTRSQENRTRLMRHGGDVWKAPLLLPATLPCLYYGSMARVGIQTPWQQHPPVITFWVVSTQHHLFLRKHQSPVPVLCWNHLESSAGPPQQDWHIHRPSDYLAGTGNCKNKSRTCWLQSREQIWSHIAERPLAFVLWKISLCRQHDDRWPSFVLQKSEFLRNFIPPFKLKTFMLMKK